MTKEECMFSINNTINLRFGYRRAIMAIATHPKKIESVEDVKNIYGVGKKIQERIKEILTNANSN